ncbi:MAG: EF2563 family selenium-dependent molybdenum hydroxylase system protein [Peptococcaceae bacterium]|nr:EF2563 family selenium-dependent molybdenum hydroxylase system protein [Peptococcaceae bacterium]
MGRIGITAVIKGANDVATGVAYRLKKCGLDIIMTEISSPLVVRRKVAFAEAVYDGTVTVEGIKAAVSGSIRDALALIEKGIIPLLVDPETKIIKEISPQVVIDARMAKCNLDTNINDAPLVIGLGPGFEAGKDVNAVIETCRGYRLGRVIYNGGAIPNTGIPGDIGGFTAERTIRAPMEGVVTNILAIGDKVKKGDQVVAVGGTPVGAEINGVVRGMVREGVMVSKGTRIANIDPRKEIDCSNISDRALSISGGVMEAVFTFLASYDR